MSPAATAASDRTTMAADAVVRPRRLARWTGACEALEGLCSSFGQVFLLDRLVVSGNAAATAANILARPQLLGLGFALSLAAVPFHVAWAILFHRLMKPVHRTLSGFALAIMLVGCALQAVTALLELAPLSVLQGAGPLGAFAPAQQQALAYLLLRLNALSFDVYTVLFGLWCVAAGVLIARSRFLPPLLGVLLAIDGVGWSLYLVPSFAQHLFPFIAAASAISEFPLQLWLLIAGVNEARWKEQAGSA